MRQLGPAERAPRQRLGTRSTSPFQALRTPTPAASDIAILPRMPASSLVGIWVVNAMVLALGKSLPGDHPPGRKRP